MDRVVYLDYVAIPLIIVILHATFVRKMTKGTSNRLFMLTVVVTLLTTVCDLVSGIVSVDAPMDEGEVMIVAVASGLYHVFHPLVMIFLIMFIFVQTRTWYLMTMNHKLVITILPYVLILVLLFSNLFTGHVFTVSPENGYTRGPLMYVIYTIAGLYMLWGVFYLFSRRKMLSRSRWTSLFLMYATNAAAVLFQMIFPRYLVEMIVIALAELFIVMLVLRPEDYLDYSTGVPNYKAFTGEIRKICVSKTPEKIIVIRFINSTQLRKYFGEEKYNSFAKDIVLRIESFCKSRGLYFDIYFEQPGRVYLIIDNYDFDFEAIVHDLYGALMENILEIESQGAKIIPRFCEICYPEDTNDPETVFNIGRQFHRIIPYDQFYTHARDIMNNDTFRIKNNIDRILNRAIKEKKFEMYYQPIYSVKEKRFVSAEALIRLFDDEYGYVSPAVFIPAAERKGLMIPIGDFVLESVFSFISSTEMNELGLSYIELNLSVAQCLQGDLADKIFALEKKYHVNPEKVNLEITETTYENFGDTTDINVKRLSENGFSFSLDDYGTGYSNMHRIAKLPLRIIKIDKTMVDDMENEAGMSVLRNTISMMKDIDKEIVCEGVEEAGQFECLAGLGVDFIQGYYFSKPLSSDDFVTFIRERNNAQKS